MVINADENKMSDQINTIPKLWDQFYSKCNPDDDFILYKNGTETLTYRNINAKSHCIAAFLLNKGIKKGDIVLILSDQSPDYFYIDLAIQFIGAINLTLSATIDFDKIDSVFSKNTIAICFINDFKTYKSNKFAFQKKSNDLDFICNVSNEDKLEEDDTIVLLSYAIEQGKVHWRNKIESLSSAKNNVIGNNTSTIFLGIDNNTANVQRLNHQEIIDVVVKSNDIYKSIKQKPIIACIQDFQFFFERIYVLYVSLYYKNKIYLVHQLDIGLIKASKPKISVLLTNNKFAEQYLKTLRKKIKQKHSFRYKYLEEAIELDQLSKSGEKITFLKKIKLSFTKKFVLKFIKKKYINKLEYLILNETHNGADLIKQYESIGLKVFEGKSISKNHFEA